jgi:Uncharacterised nucleotidyltransferase
MSAPAPASFPALRPTLAALLRGDARPWRDVPAEPAAFLAACAADDLAPLLWHHLHKTVAFGAWPPAVREGLAERARASAARELLVARELARVIAALAERDIRPLLFKGTALAYSVYPHPGLRPRTDTDLLVREPDVPGVRAVLGSLGYGAAVQCDGELLFRQFEVSREDEVGARHVLDVHWAISTQALFADLLAYDELHPRSMPIPALGSSAAGFGLVDALLLALIHPVMHHKNEQRLLWTYDVHLLAGRLDDAGFATLVERARAKGIAAVCAHGLEGAREWLGTAVPDAALPALRAMPAAEQPTAAYLTPGRAWLDETASSLRGLGSWRERLRLLREIALPSPAYMLRAYGVSDGRWGKALLPALYAHRGVRGVLRVLAGRK